MGRQRSNPVNQQPALNLKFEKRPCGRRPKGPQAIPGFLSTFQPWFQTSTGISCKARPTKRGSPVPQDFSFDVVSKTDMQEVTNAIQQAQKELAQRFDFKGSKSSIELNAEEIIL